MGAGHDRLIRELVMVQNTGHRRVGMLAGPHKEFCALDERWRRKLEKHFDNYGIQGTTLPQEHFKSLGRFATGGTRSKDVQIFEFKAFQVRIYGIVTPVAGMETFVGFKVIDDKKTNKADQGLLARVAKMYAPYLD